MSDYTTGSLTVDTWFRRVVISGGCTSAPSAAVKVTINTTTPSITLTSAVGTLNQNICNGGSISNITYTVANSTGATVSNLPTGVSSAYVAGVLTISGTPTVEGTYVYVVKTTGSCGEATTTGTITVNPVISVSPLTGLTICSGTSTTIQGPSVSGGNGSYSFEWQSSSVSGSGFNSAASINSTLNYITDKLYADTYFKLLIKSGGCTAESNEYVVTVDQTLPILTLESPFLNAQDVCVNTALNTNIEYTFGGNAVNATTSGLPAGVTGTINGITGRYVIAGTPTEEGTFNYTVSTTGSCGVATATGTITVNPSITVLPLNGATICTGSNAALVGTLPTGGNGSYTYSWKSSILSGAPASAFVSASGINNSINYTTDILTATTKFIRVISSGGCSDTSAIVTVNVDQLPVASITNGNGTICSNESYTLPVNAADTLHGTTIGWSTNGAGTITTTPTTLLTPTYTAVTADAGKNVTLILTLTSNNTCGNKTDTASFVIAVNPLPLATIVGESSNLCPADSITLKSFAANGTISWSHNGQGSILNGSTINPTYASSLLDAGKTVVLTMKVEACTTPITAQATYNVVVYQLPVAPVSAGVDDTISLGSSIELKAQGSSILTWNWSPSTTLDNQYISSPVASPLETTKYAVKAVHLNGCISRDTVTIVVLKDYNLIISNLMTPNGDGKNDTWGIGNIENYPGTEVIIVNRNGEIVFEDANYSNNWDGKFNGKDLPDATYYYIVKFATSDKVYKGAVTLLHQ